MPPERVMPCRFLNRRLVEDFPSGVRIANLCSPSPWLYGFWPHQLQWLFPAWSSRGEVSNRCGMLPPPRRIQNFKVLLHYDRSVIGCIWKHPKKGGKKHWLCVNFTTQKWPLRFKIVVKNGVSKNSFVFAKIWEWARVVYLKCLL